MRSAVVLNYVLISSTVLVLSRIAVVVSYSSSRLSLKGFLFLLFFFLLFFSSSFGIVDIDATSVHAASYFITYHFVSAH